MKTKLVVLAVSLFVSSRTEPAGAQTHSRLYGHEDAKITVHRPGPGPGSISQSEPQGLVLRGAEAAP